MPIATEVPHIAPGKSYQYMGVMLNVELSWDDHKEYACKKVVAYQALLCNKQLTTDNKIYVSNMVSNAFVAYGMCVVPYPRAWLADLQCVMLTTIKQSMQVPSNANDEPFFMAPKEGGRGLIHLLDLQAVVVCSSMLCELTSLALSAETASANWYQAYMFNNSTTVRWIEVLKAQEWQAWPKLKDLDWIGHFAPDPALAFSLVQQGIFCWLQMTQGGVL